MTVSFTMETDNLNKEAIFSESGISTNITCTISFHSESSLKINERFFFLLNNKMKMLQAGGGGKGGVIMLKCLSPKSNQRKSF